MRFNWQLPQQLATDSARILQLQVIFSYTDGSVCVCACVSVWECGVSVCVCAKTRINSLGCKFTKGAEQVHGKRWQRQQVAAYEHTNTCTYTHTHAHVHK